jgi:hypothetical protein
MPKRNKPDTLSPLQVHELLERAERLNDAICRPLISVVSQGVV